MVSAASKPVLSAPARPAMYIVTLPEPRNSNNHPVPANSRMPANSQTENGKFFGGLVVLTRMSNGKGQPPEPAADELRLVSGLTGWVRLAEPPGSVTLSNLSSIFGAANEWTGGRTICGPSPGLRSYDCSAPMMVR